VCGMISNHRSIYMVVGDKNFKKLGFFRFF
jgi:hypothetical protein